MTTTTTDSLARAIERLGAVEIAPGRYAYRDYAARRFYIVSADDLATLGDDYSRWCADTQAVEMPSWWTPEQQVAWRCPACGVHESGRAWIPETGGGVGHEQYRITASLETGEEIPA